MASLINAAPSLFEPGSGDEPARASLLNGVASFAPAPSLADAWDANSKAYGDFVARERASGVAAGTLDAETGWPTQAGLEDSARQVAQSVLMGSVAPVDSGFSSWFGKSVIKDAAGQPLRVFHGTADPALAFSEGRPAFFTPNADHASFYAESGRPTYADTEPQPNVIPAYLKIENPKIVDGASTSDLSDALKQAMAGGHDGAIIKNKGVPDNYVTFHPSSISTEATAAPSGAEGPSFINYHGSGADFNAFSNDYIGTGEGAQAFGMGHYTADREDVGRGYRNALAGKTTFAPEPGAPGLDAQAFGEHLRDLTHETHDLTAGQLGSVDMVSGLVARDMAQGQSVPEIRAWVKSTIRDRNTAAAYNAVLDNAQNVHVNPGWTRVGDERYDADNPVHRVAFYLDRAGGDRAAALKSVEEETQGLVDKIQATESEFGTPLSSNNYRRAAIDRLAEMQDHIESGDPIPKYQAPGHMYEVRVNADPAHFLDWDKPLSEQTPHVQAALSDLGVTMPGDVYQVRPNGDKFSVWRRSGDGPNDYAQLPNGRSFATQADAQKAVDATAQMQGLNPTGREIYTRGLPLMGSDAAMNAGHLNKNGIPGIRYLDGGSRSDGSGTSNHVIFDPATITILRKYGIAGLMAGGTAAATQGQTTQ